MGRGGADLWIMGEEGWGRTMEEAKPGRKY